MRLTESRTTRNEQLLMMPTELLTNREWLHGELLSRSECRRPRWCLDMNCQACLTVISPVSYSVYTFSAEVDLHVLPTCTWNLPLSRSTCTLVGWLTGTSNLRTSSWMDLVSICMVTIRVYIRAKVVYQSSKH